MTEAAARYIGLSLLFILLIGVLFVFYNVIPA